MKMFIKLSVMSLFLVSVLTSCAHHTCPAAACCKESSNPEQCKMTPEQCKMKKEQCKMKKDETAPKETAKK